ncbi:hypothetical protein SAMN04488550_2898 [Gordonia malaquae]|uniref:Uncharacterized protein n=1 Tax=Gordonia malaquae NBRC 108250 TaxID=1223542 RepID=M3UHE7_GORML|nr:hypothetical protein [Gordonia malaquae]GAC78770.1 hypothetical protein GM1_004_02150 [Gordonia malaquae NBRC 108250]SED65199.1 hypothetical protein SAMN04488550_2898 [Gordonia malaquae]
MTDYPDYLAEDVHPEDYAADQIALRQRVCEAYFAPERVARLAGLEPYVIMGGLLEAINEAIAAEQARIDDGTVRPSSPLRPLRAVGWFEALHAILALHPVRVLFLSGGQRVLGLYDDDPTSPTYRTFSHPDRWLHELVIRYGGNRRAAGVGNIRLHLRLKARALSVDDVADDENGASA